MSFTVVLYEVQIQTKNFTLDGILTIALQCIERVDDCKAPTEKWTYLHMENIWLSISDPMLLFEGLDLTILNVPWVHFNLHAYVDNPYPDIILTITMHDMTRCKWGQKVSTYPHKNGDDGVNITEM